MEEELPKTPSEAMSKLAAFQIAEVRAARDAKLHDHFAGCVLNGLFASGGIPAPTDDKEGDAAVLANVAASCYAFADAMMAERAKKPS
jgi:hypothetical protein